MDLRLRWRGDSSERLGFSRDVYLAADCRRNHSFAEYLF